MKRYGKYSPILVFCLSNDIPYLVTEDFKTTILSQIGAGRRIGMLGLMPSLDDLENHNLPPHHPLLLAVLIADDLQAFLILQQIRRFPQV